VTDQRFSETSQLDIAMNNADFAGGPGAATAAGASGPFSMFAAAAGGVHHPLQEAIMARIRPFGLTVSDLYNGMQAHKYVSRKPSIFFYIKNDRLMVQLKITKLIRTLSQSLYSVLNTLDFGKLHAAIH
jgi:hypothetical protein